MYNKYFLFKVNYLTGYLEKNFLKFYYWHFLIDKYYLKQTEKEMVL